MTSTHSLPTPSERVLPTLNADGSRRWLRPRLSPGRFWRARRVTAWALIVLFALLPFVRIYGAPAILLDVGKRQFTLFGKTFLPTDSVLLAVLLVGTFVSLFLVTAILGRVWCGWACPQTVYLEFVYRPIERFFEGHPGRRGQVGRKATPSRTAAKYAVFLIVSFALANAFLSYFVGTDSLRRWMSSSPADHPTSFAVMALTTGLMFFNFAWFREQTCIVACPYGRLQSVLLDAHSLIIGYDVRRGEPRGRRGQARDPVHAPDAIPGDCVDCGLCAETCPTGVDIRGGLRMECIGCAQCIDVCDTVMDRLKRPRGLIRYGTQASANGDHSSFWRPRLFGYLSVLALIGGIFTALLLRSTTSDVTVLRGMGLPFTELANGYVANPIRLKITNRTREPRSYRIELPESGGARVLPEMPAITVMPAKSLTRDLAVAIPANRFVAGKRPIRLRIIDDQNNVTEVHHELLGPQRVARTDLEGKHDARP